MLALGIVLIVLAVLFGLGVSVSSGDTTKMSVFGVDFGLAVPTLFLLGAATGIALFLGLWLTKKGLGRGYRRHKEVKELRQQVAATPTTTEPADGATAVDDDRTDLDRDTRSAAAGDRVAGGPVAGDPAAGDPVAGGPVAGDEVVPRHAATSGDSARLGSSDTANGTGSGRVREGLGDDGNSRTVDLDEADRLARERHTVADGTESGEHRP
ncbi:hypothetical protein EV138_2843 [Kribbella voronezhensis]|uniref:Uncharacterized protein n=1 Tax=Kribbella voronezhensis TaxID=2512212 RepID=A0A4R7TB80_9ACTN|nr:hypothetical protein [Kribbella voronezhensis]TDU89281.1 hypothetical protein EV138_2843 [Kribbella voronezhensis]